MFLGGRRHRLSVMRKLILFLLVFCGLFKFQINAQSICFNYKGEWSPWEDIRYFKVYRNNDCSGLTLKTNGGLKALSFQITNFRFPDKKEREEHLKSGKSFSYYGTIEYYVNSALPTAEDIAKRCLLVAPYPRSEIETPTLRRSVCEIRIKPFKKEPEVWNIFFDNIGIAISTKGLKFK